MSVTLTPRQIRGKGLRATFTRRQTLLVRTLSVIAERELPRPGLEFLARFAGYASPQGAHNNILRLQRRGEIPAEWWPRRRRRSA